MNEHRSNFNAFLITIFSVTLLAVFTLIGFIRFLFNA